MPGWNTVRPFPICSWPSTPPSIYCCIALVTDTFGSLLKRELNYSLCGQSPFVASLQVLSVSSPGTWKSRRITLDPRRQCRPWSPNCERVRFLSRWKVVGTFRVFFYAVSNRMDKSASLVPRSIQFLGCLHVFLLEQSASIGDRKV